MGNSFFSWRTAIGSISLGVLFTIILFYLTGQNFSLSGLDLFFAITTVISIGFNLWQLFRDRYKYEPLKNSLIGLFNDLKNRQLRAHQRQILITSPAGMETSVESLRLEFYDFVEETKVSLEEIREHVVAAIYTLEPDASTQQVFRASEFGLNAQERKFREEGMNRFIENSQLAGSAVTPRTTTPTDSVEDSIQKSSVSNQVINDLTTIPTSPHPDSPQARTL